MRNFCKKVLALMLAFAFSVSGMAVTSFAATEEDSGNWKFLSSEVVETDDGSKWVSTLYEKDSDISYLRAGITTKDVKNVYHPINDTTHKVTLYATFYCDYDNLEASCASKRYKQNLPGFIENSFKSSSPSRACTVTLKFSWSSAGGPSSQTLKVGCNFNGYITNGEEA